MKIKTLSIMLIIMTLFVSTSSLAQSSIVDSMEFQTPAAQLSLNDAMSLMLKDNASINGCLVDIEKAKVSYLRQDDIVSKGRREFGYLDSSSPNYLKSIKIEELKRDFIKPNAQRNYEATVVKLKAELEQSYYEVQQAAIAVEINKSNVEVAREINEKTIKKHELGLVAKKETIDSELNLIKAKNEYNSSVNSLKSKKMALNIKLGRNVMDEIILKDELKFVEYTPTNLSSGITSALSNRNEIKASSNNYEIKKITLEAERIINKSSNYVIEAQADFDKAARELDDLKKSIEMEVRTIYMDILKKQEEIKAGQKSVELSAEGLKISKVSYEKGMVTLTDVEKAQLALQQSQLALSKLILDYNITVTRFKDSIGIGRNEAIAQ